MTTVFITGSIVEEEIDGGPSSLCESVDSLQLSASASSSLVSDDVRQAQITEAAELLRCLGDQIQAEFGDQIDSIVRQIDWTLPRTDVMVELQRLTTEMIQHVNNELIRVSTLDAASCSRSHFHHPLNSRCLQDRPVVRKLLAYRYLPYNLSKVHTLAY
jgi:hypothetical protein